MIGPEQCHELDSGPGQAPQRRDPEGAATP
jgi:hypothetical protein